MAVKDRKIVLINICFCHKLVYLSTSNLISYIKYINLQRMK